MVEGDINSDIKDIVKENQLTILRRILYE